MRHFLPIIILFIFALNSQAQVQRIPLHEGFTSSTCAPCRPGNANADAIYATAPHKQILLRYQMSWPGSGDPYFTAEGNTRRSFYGVTGVPNLRLDGTGNYNPNPPGGGGNFHAGIRDNAYNVPAYMTIDVDYKVSCKTIEVDVELIALQNYAGSNFLHVAIIENETYDNRKSNGETKFTKVMKKMLPNANGTSLGAITQGDTLNFNMSYTFNGDYRLPPNANSPINNSTENSVEEFFDLGVVAFVQNSGNRQVHQAAYGVSSTKVDAALAELTTATNLVSSAGPFDIAAVFQNWQDSVITSAVIKYSIDNGSVETMTYSNLNLGRGDFVNVVFSTQWAPPSIGSYDLKIWIDQFNGGILDEIVCNDTINEVLTVHTGVMPVAGWTAQAVGTVRLFTNTSTGDPWEPSSYLWDFGDGLPTSTAFEPIHAYTTGDGIYNTCLTVSNSTGTHTYCENVLIGAVGISDFIDQGIKVFPNPTTGLVNFQNDLKESVELELFSAAGIRLGYYVVEEGSKTEINLEGHTPGTYFIRIISKEGESIKKIELR